MSDLVASSSGSTDHRSAACWLYGIRIYTVRAIDEANAILVHIVQNGGRIVFVGTKRQARDAVADAAEKSGQFYVNQRWLGGTLTNFQKSLG